MINWLMVGLLIKAKNYWIIIHTSFLTLMISIIKTTLTVSIISFRWRTSLSFNRSLWTLSFNTIWASARWSWSLLLIWISKSCCHWLGVIILRRTYQRNHWNIFAIILLFWASPVRNNWTVISCWSIFECFF